MSPKIQQDQIKRDRKNAVHEIYVNKWKLIFVCVGVSGPFIFQLFAEKKEIFNKENNNRHADQTEEFDDDVSKWLRKSVTTMRRLNSFALDEHSFALWQSHRHRVPISMHQWTRLTINLYYHCFASPSDESVRRFLSFGIDLHHGAKE